MHHRRHNQSNQWRIGEIIENISENNQREKAKAA